MSFERRPKTTKRIMLNYIEEANEIALNSDIEVDITLKVRTNDVSVYFTFFHNGTNCSIDLYQFWERKKNDEYFEIAKSIIKNRKNFENYSSKDFY